MSLKTRIGSLLFSDAVQTSIVGQAARAVVRRTGRWYDYSPEFLTDFRATSRPHYAYCMLRAAEFARRLGHDRISAIEFGVAGGNGLTFMAEFAKRVERRTGVSIDCYGFDTGQGMPDPENVLDLPYWFRRAQYVMDEQRLRERIPDATLVIGNVCNTISTFLDDFKPAPIGVMFHDMDYWSSTRDALQLFAQAQDLPQHFLPRIYNYFDDIIGSHWEMYGSQNGQLLSIEQFNAKNPRCQIQLNQNLLPDGQNPWRYQIYYTHIFDHPRYNDYIGDKQQEALENALQLK